MGKYQKITTYGKIFKYSSKEMRNTEFILLEKKINHKTSRSNYFFAVFHYLMQMAKFILKKTATFLTSIFPLRISFCQYDAYMYSLCVVTCSAEISMLFLTLFNSEDNALNHGLLCRRRPRYKC